MRQGAGPPPSLGRPSSQPNLRGPQRYSVKLSWEPENDNDSPHSAFGAPESTGPRVSDEGATFSGSQSLSAPGIMGPPAAVKTKTSQSNTSRVESGPEGHVEEVELDSLVAGGGEVDVDLKCKSCGDPITVSQIRTKLSPQTEVDALCSSCRKIENESHLADYLAAEGPKHGATIITSEIPFMSLWEVAESWRWESPRFSQVGHASRVDSLLNLCQKALAECPDSQLASALELADDSGNLPILREAILERVSFEDHDSGIMNVKDLEQIHLLRLCGSAAGSRFHPLQIEEWSGPQNLPPQTNRRRSSVVSVAVEIMRTGRVVTLEMAVREFELALRRNWMRVRRIIEDQLLRSEWVSSMWIVSLYIGCQAVEEKCVEEIHSRGPSFYLRLGEENILPRILVSKLMEQLTVSMRRASISSAPSNTSWVQGATPHHASEDMEWDEMDNYSLQYCFEGDDDDDSEGDEMDEELDDMAGGGEDIPKTGILMDQSAPASQETSITRQISGAAMDFVRRSSMSN